MEIQMGKMFSDILNKLDVKTIIIIIFITLFSVLLTVGLGYDFKRTPLTVVFLLLARKSRAVSIFVIILSIIPIAYTAAGLEFGRINAGYIYSVLETNTAESKEFLSILSAANYLFAVILFIVLLFSMLLWRKPFSFNWRKFALFMLALIVLFSGTQIYKFYREITTSYLNYYIQYSQMLSSLGESNFILHKRSDAKEKEIRVVIIGESVRKDHMSLYGFPHDTTPFLNSADGIFIDGYVAAAPNTVTSLARSLSITNAQRTKVDFANNAVSLANAAGYDTFWISNQGYMGQSDTMTTLIAKMSKHFVFLNKGEYRSGVKDDFELLDRLDEALNTNTDKNKLIFLHMAGSHINACERVWSFPINFKLDYGKEFDCYLATIEKLDFFVKSIVENLKSKNLTYSVIYFSDHGTAYRKQTMFSGNEIGFKHGENFKQNYEIPLFMLDSDISGHIVIKKSLSAFNFMDIFASWIGFDTDKTDAAYTISNFPENKHLEVYNLGQNIDFESLPDQKAVF
jgi:glucan phosphoethanolaminetransferase (alkaline phosphatase superfamily)